MFPVEERPVPKSDIPGEAASPTQPFPVAPPALAPQKVSAEDAWGPTPQDRETRRNWIRGLRDEGIFTPPSTQGTLVVPGNIGGMTWSGYSPHRGWRLCAAGRSTLRIVSPIPAVAVGLAVYLAALGSADRSGHDRRQDSLADSAGFDAGLWRQTAACPCGIDQPGWSDRYRGRIGFNAGTFDPFLRAFDIETGKELWKAQLPAGGHATPMTYRLGANGKQYVLIAAGGHPKITEESLSDALVAFTLP